ncbi:uncharacterized protein LOC106076177 [Biomphalaria glabrata]|uniref:Uncharacterized protein LOC106076177 n=1 Tax=Biomphalaria glabrata TaxID=6526 RepID=A0A9W3B7G9_BIOGL|nr:uncharacterized protein LOC106076177 [Biomphalaria glabrata]XP_055895508.1 uncharacterized protein LOC106076177 [Biomphalaria glabrata]
MASQESQTDCVNTVHSNTHEICYLHDCNRCNKDPAHKAFVPYAFIDFLIGDPVLRFIKHIGERTVKLQISHLSSGRPNYKNDGPNGGRRYGTGFVQKLASLDTVINSNLPQKASYFLICTANHVIFDDSESKATKVTFFYEGVYEHGVKIAKGVKVIEADWERDYAVVLCCTSDEELILRFQDLFTLPRSIPSVPRSTTKSHTALLAQICFQTMSKLSFVRTCRMGRFYTHLTKWLQESRNRFSFLDTCSHLCDLSANNKLIKDFFILYVKQAKQMKWTGELLKRLNSTYFTQNKKNVDSCFGVLLDLKRYAINKLLMCSYYDEFNHNMNLIMFFSGKKFKRILLDDKKLGELNETMARPKINQKKLTVDFCSGEKMDINSSLHRFKDMSLAELSCRSVSLCKANTTNKEPQLVFQFEGFGVYPANIFHSFHMFNIKASMPVSLEILTYQAYSFLQRPNQNLYAESLEHSPNSKFAISKDIEFVNVSKDDYYHSKSPIFANEFFNINFCNDFGIFHIPNLKMIDFQEQYDFCFIHFQNWINSMTLKQDTTPELILSILVTLRILEINLIDTGHFVRDFVEHMSLKFKPEPFSILHLLVSDEFEKYLQRASNTEEMCNAIKQFKSIHISCYREFVDHFTDIVDIVKDRLRGFFRFFSNGLELSTGLVVHISHPHGKEKQITVGERATEEAGVYSHNAATCPGGSGGPLCIFPQGGNEISKLLLHSGSDRESGLGVASSFNVKFKE